MGGLNLVHFSFFLKTINFIFPYSGANKTIENKEMGGLVVSKGNVYIIFKIVFSRNLIKKRRKQTMLKKHSKYDHFSTLLETEIRKEKKRAVDCGPVTETHLCWGGVGTRKNDNTNITHEYNNVLHEIFRFFFFV
jgi:hypothetical protein